MVQAKTELFESKLVETASLFKALAHPARLRILLFLSESKTCITGDISEALPLGRTTINQHLQELKNSGLISGHIEGAKTKYCLNTEKVDELKKSALKFLSEINMEQYHCD